jgi:hypothetical protein
LYEIELGRRDSLTSYSPSAETYLPAFSLNVSGLLEDLQTVGLDEVDLVALSGESFISHSPLMVALKIISKSGIKDFKLGLIGLLSTGYVLWLQRLIKTIILQE